MGNVNSVSGRGTNAVEMGNKSSANSGISEVAFHHAKLALSVFFPPIKLNSLALYRLEFALMCLIPINISNNTRVPEVYDGVVNEESGGGRRMENIEVVIFDPRTIEIGRGVCVCVKGDGVFRVSPFTNSYNVSINPNLSEGNISCYFVLPVLIEKYKRVLPHITTVVLAPPVSWVIGVIKLLSKLGNVGDGTGCARKGDGGVICGKPNWFVALNIVI